MKRIGICLILVLLLLSGCTKKSTDASYTSVKPVGSVPTGFKTIVEENLFYSATVSRNRLVRYDAVEDGYFIQMYDIYGHLLADYVCQTDTHTFHMRSLIATSDGGFLFALGFYDHQYSDGSWESQKGLYSRVVKCDATGELQWDVSLTAYDGQMLEYCIERDDAYYFFGDQETPETDVTGIASPTDIHMMKMSKTGEVLKTHIVGGSDYDWVNEVEQADGQFIICGYTQSEDGDFTGRGDVKIAVTDDFQVISIQKSDYDRRECLGKIDGEVIYSDDDLFKKFDDGRLTVVIDYGDFYVIVSENITGQYEKQPAFISHGWYYSETVYGAYNKQGKVLWKATVDSSPDWDAVLKELEEAS